MNEETPSSQQRCTEAKAALNDAERAYERAKKSYFRLFRDRVDREGGHRRGEPTEAEMEARRVFDATRQGLGVARDNLRYLQMTVPRPKQSPRRQNLEDDE